MIGIIGALGAEVNGIKKLMTNVEEETISKITFYKGEINNNPCVLAQCGVGKVNAAICAQTMILKYNVDEVINTGVAGAVNSKLGIGDIVISSGVVHHDIRCLVDDGETEMFKRGTIQFSDTEFAIELPASKKLTDQILESCKKCLDDTPVYFGIVASGEQFISSRVARMDISENFNAYCCEMEGASIGQVCYRNNVPFAIIRAISDTISQNEYMDFEKFVYVASEKTLKVIKALFEVE